MYRICAVSLSNRFSREISVIYGIFFLHILPFLLLSKLNFLLNSLIGKILGKNSESITAIGSFRIIPESDVRLGRLSGGGRSRYLSELVVHSERLSKSVVRLGRLSGLPYVRGTCRSPRVWGAYRGSSCIRGMRGSRAAAPRGALVCCLGRCEKGGGVSSNCGFEPWWAQCLVRFGRYFSNCASARGATPYRMLFHLRKRLSRRMDTPGCVAFDNAKCGW